MILSLAKVELKKTFAFYILLFLFFVFWNFFSFLSFFLFENLEKFLELYQEKIGLTIFVSSEQGNKTVNALISEIKTLPFVKKVEIISPSELLERWKNDLPFEIISLFDKDELLKAFPYLIKVYPSSYEHLKYFQEYFMLISKVLNNISYESSKLDNFLTFTLFFKKFFWGLAISWLIFYFLFLILLNFFINTFIKKNIKIFILLGGSFFKLNLIRIIIFVTTMAVAYICSFLLYFYFAKNLVFIFDFLKIYPDFKNLSHFIYFLIYTFFILLIFPILVIFLSSRINEI